MQNLLQPIFTKFSGRWQKPSYTLVVIWVTLR